MDITICLDCAASSEGILPACPDCLSTHIEHMAQLQAGEIIYACGRCRQPRRLGPPENPKVSQAQFARIQKGAVVRLPLTIWNTVFKCTGCRGWNWVTLDDRITGFDMTCPDCGEQASQTLGRRVVFAKPFFQPVQLGELRQTGKPVTLKCGHVLFLPKVFVEGTEPGPTAPAPRVAAATSGSPSAEKKKTQPIPPVPPR